jgi:hypothetical protein
MREQIHKQLRATERENAYLEKIIANHGSGVEI